MRMTIPKMDRKNIVIAACVFMCSLITFSFGMEKSTGKEIEDKFQALHKKLSDFAAAPVFASMNLDSADQIFTRCIDKYPAVKLMMRINSSGLIINETIDQKSSNPYRSISSQKWFEQVSKLQKNYYGTTHEADGSVYLFWVWPLFSQSKQFAGALSVKIDPSELLTSDVTVASLSFKLLFREKVIFTNGWQNSDTANKLETEWGFTGDTLFKCIYVNENSGNAKVANESMQSKSVEPVIPPPVTLDASQLEIGYKKKDPLHTSFVPVMFLCLAGIVAVILYCKYRGRKQTETIARDTTQQTFEVELQHQNAETAGKEDVSSVSNNDAEKETTPIELSSNENAEVNSHDATVDISKMEDEYEKIRKMVFKEAIIHFKPSVAMEHSSEDDFKTQLIRHNVYREIHNEILHWVVFESDRLARNLEELTRRVDSLSNSQEPELEIIKNEIGRIAQNVENFKKMNFGNNKEI